MRYLALHWLAAIDGCGSTPYKSEAAYIKYKLNIK